MAWFDGSTGPGQGVVEFFDCLVGLVLAAQDVGDDDAILQHFGVVVAELLGACVQDCSGMGFGFLEAAELCECSGKVPDRRLFAGLGVLMDDVEKVGKLVCRFLHLPAVCPHVRPGQAEIHRVAVLAAEGAFR
jgi:hypothetical protein